MKRIPGTVVGTTALGMVLGLAGIARAADASKPAPTFTKDVAPILQRSCQNRSGYGEAYDRDGLMLTFTCAIRENPPRDISRCL